MIDRETEDVPFSADSDLVRARHTRLTGGGQLPDPDADGWGAFDEAKVYDNEDWDRFRDVRFDAVLAMAPGTFQVFRYQNGDLEEAQLLALAHSAFVEGVKYLDLRRNFRTGPDAFVAMLETGKLAHVEWLNLESCYQADDSVFEAVATHLPNLRGIDIGSTKITDRGLLRLADLPALERVVGMFVDTLTAEGVQAFVTRRPDVGWYFMQSGR